MKNASSFENSQAVGSRKARPLLPAICFRLLTGIVAALISLPSSAHAQADPPQITTPPKSQVVTSGSTVTLEVLTTGEPPLNYQWRKSGANITGSINSSHTISNASAEHIGRYSVIVSNVWGSVTSSDAILSVLNSGTELRLYSSLLFNSQFYLSFPTDPLSVYTLEESTTLDTNSWTPRLALSGDGGIRTLSIPALPQSHRFYRISSTLLEQGPKAIYGIDDRIEVFQEALPHRRQLAASVCGMITRAALSTNGDGTISISTTPYWQKISLTTGRPLCDGERFYNQPTGPSCTAFLIAPDLVATAGHCMLGSSTNLPAFAFIFGFEMLDLQTAATNFPANHVYYGSTIERYQDGSAGDYAIMNKARLSRYGVQSSATTLALPTQCQLRTQ